MTDRTDDGRNLHPFVPPPVGRFRGWIRCLRALQNRTLEGLWCRVFWVLGLLRRDRVRRWTDLGGRGVVLVLAPHPDDEVAGCAGAILAHREAGDRVVLVIVTDGSGSSAFSLPAERMRRIRRQESVRGASQLGVGEEEIHFLDLLEADWSEAELEGVLGPLLASIRPSLVYAPSGVDFHPDHRAVARCLARCLEENPAPVRVYPVSVPLTRVLQNRILPIADEGGVIESAFAAHVSQTGTLAATRRRRRLVGAGLGFGQAEDFWELSAEDYASVHVETDSERGEARGGRVRGMRFDAWTDPLAFGFGRSYRQGLLARLVGIRRSYWSSREFAVRSVDPSSAGDVEGIRRLFQGGFERRSAQDWVWKYVESPSEPGVDNSWVTVTTAGHVVFHQGGVPSVLRVGDRRLLAMVAFDAVTRSDYRGRGLLLSSSRKIYAAWRDQGIDVILGCPNQRWGSAVQGLGWVDVGFLAWRFLPLAPERTLAVRLPGWARSCSPWLERQRILSTFWSFVWRAGEGNLEVREWPGDGNPAAGSSGPGTLEGAGEIPRPSGVVSEWGRGACLEAGNERWRWRYLRAQPEPFEGRLVLHEGRPSACVFHRLQALPRERIALLGEVRWAPGELRAARVALGRAAESARASGATMLYALANPGSATDRLLLRSGFLPRGRRFTLRAIPLSSAAEELDFGSLPWNLQGGDFDFY